MARDCDGKRGLGPKKGCVCGEGKAGAADFGEPGVIAIGGDFGQLLDATASDRGDNASFPITNLRAHPLF